jgi:hypothetical protein
MASAMNFIAIYSFQLQFAVKLKNGRPYKVLGMIFYSGRVVLARADLSG